MADNQRIEDLRRRVQKDPASIAFAQLAEELRRAGGYDESVQVCRAGLDLHPGYLSARVTLGRALIELNDLDTARAELEQVLKSAPENLAAIRGLAEIHHRQGALVPALAQYRAALALARNDPDLQRTVDELARQVEPPPPPASADGLSFEQMESEFLQNLPAPPPKPAAVAAPTAPEPPRAEAVADTPLPALPDWATTAVAAAAVTPPEPAAAEAVDDIASPALPDWATTTELPVPHASAADSGAAEQPADLSPIDSVASDAAAATIEPTSWWSPPEAVDDTAPPALPERATTTELPVTSAWAADPAPTEQPADLSPGDSVASDTAAATIEPTSWWSPPPADPIVDIVAAPEPVLEPVALDEIVADWPTATELPATYAWVADPAAPEQQPDHLSPGDSIASDATAATVEPTSWWSPPPADPIADIVAAPEPVLEPVALDEIVADTAEGDRAGRTVAVLEQWLDAIHVARAQPRA